MKCSTLFSLFFLFVVGGLTFSVKQLVLELENEIASVRTQITQHEETLHILTAEWAYLNNPQRLQGLAEEKLGLILGDHSQFVSMENVGSKSSPGLTIPNAQAIHLASASSDAR